MPKKEEREGQTQGEKEKGEKRKEGIKRGSKEKREEGRKGEPF